MKLINAALPLTLLFMSACSPTGKITLKGIDVGTRTVGSSTYVDMEAIVTMGNLKFPNVEVPILNPTNMQSLGQMALQSLDDGTNRLLVSLDYESATHLDPTLGSTLPNSRGLPSQLGLGNTAMIGIPIMQNSRIYIGGDIKKDLFVGAAISIPALDSVLSQVPMPLNIFFNFPISPIVLGEAGFFTGTTAGKSGVAVFVKRSVPRGSPIPMSALRVLTSASSTISENSTANPSLPSGGEELQHMNAITLYKLDRLLNKHATLRVK